MSNIYYSPPGFLPDSLKLRAKLVYCLLVKSRKRLVHKHYPAVHGKCSGKSRTLLHTAGKLMNRILSEIPQMHHFKILLRSFFLFALWHSRKLHSEFHIVYDIEPRIKGRLLKHNNSVRSGAFNFFVIKYYTARCGSFKPCNKIKQS